jgi:hypothetical protein
MATSPACSASPQCAHDSRAIAADVPRASHVGRDVVVVVAIDPRKAREGDDDDTWSPSVLEVGDGDAWREDDVEPYASSSFGLQRQFDNCS